ncbi:YybH family protein [Streptomyces qaidamensis]|uniref:YybH family protein n=1 Tax=Streptomyces qaidamensis TaxID=1783515 RepID=UPI0036E30B69
MSELLAELENHTAHYVEAVSACDFETVEKYYTADAVAVWEPGNPLSGDERRKYQREFLQARPRMAAKPRRQVFVTGETALMIVDRTIDITGADGTTEHLAGVGVDVLTRGEDGVWRYAIDDPFGQAD